MLMKLLICLSGGGCAAYITFRCACITLNLLSQGVFFTTILGGLFTLGSGVVALLLLSEACDI